MNPLAVNSSDTFRRSKSNSVLIEMKGKKDMKRAAVSDEERKTIYVAVDVELIEIDGIKETVSYIYIYIHNIIA